MQRPGRAPSICDYAIIGDCRSVALVSRHGSVDWLCWPRFDSPSLFGALLDRDKGGRFAVTPSGQFRSERCYVDDTNVLVTTFHTESGVLRLTDFMPVASEQDKRNNLWADHQLLRILECTQGEVEVDIACDPRPDYARVVPKLRDRGPLGFYYEHRGQALILRSDIPLSISEGYADVAGRTTLKTGERRYLSAVYAVGEPAFIPPLGAEADGRLAMTLAWWRQWAGQVDYAGPYRETVVRSALCLKLMTYAPSGAVIASPTTSLPEALGGVRNWDYRYCWLRDASFTLQSLFELGQHREAEAFVAWMLHSTRLSWPELQILYDVHGETRLPERELEHLAGYAGSRPVRIGNDARNQLQLDIYGEVLDAVYEFVRRGGKLDFSTRRMLRGFGETVCRRWQEPDEGIWEIRADRRHHTYSKVMCWVALDRLVSLHHTGQLQIPVERYTQVGNDIRHEIEARGYNDRLGSYVSVFDGDEVDASLLLLMRYRFVDPHSPRARGTFKLITQRLGRDGLFYRYLGDSDGLPPGEGAFGICSFWAVDCLALQGDIAAADAAFQKMLGYANDLGLYAEEVDPGSGRALGNFPQAFTHVGLIDAAITLERARRAEVQDIPPRVTQKTEERL